MDLKIHNSCVHFTVDGLLSLPVFVSMLMSLFEAFLVSPNLDVMFKKMSSAQQKENSETVTFFLHLFPKRRSHLVVSLPKPCKMIDFDCISVVADFIEKEATMLWEWTSFLMYSTAEDDFGKKQKGREWRTEKSNSKINGILNTQERLSTISVKLYRILKYTERDGYISSCLRLVVNVQCSRIPLFLMKFQHKKHHANDTFSRKLTNSSKMIKHLLLWNLQCFCNLPPFGLYVLWLAASEWLFCFFFCFSRKTKFGICYALKTTAASLCDCSCRVAKDVERKRKRWTETEKRTNQQTVQIVRIKCADDTEISKR